MKPPIVEMLQKYAKSRAARLHMPGHKGELCKFDITELSFSDNLQNPQGVIEQAQRLYAKLFGAEFAHFVTNGSTAGVMALVGAGEGGFLTERASHTSVFNALKLFGRKTAVVQNGFREGKYFPVTPQQIEKGLDIYPWIKTALVTYPNYYGECCDLEAISKICKERRVALFADSAHGAHFGISPHLPPHAINFCDACTVSVHKTLPALTQSAVVLVNGQELSGRIKKQLNVFNTSSPNYMLLASIDHARYLLEKHGERAVQRLRKRLPFSENDDFTRVVIDGTLNGMVPEFCDGRRTVLIVSVFETKRNIRALLRAAVTGASEEAGTFPPSIPAALEEAFFEVKSE